MCQHNNSYLWVYYVYIMYDCVPFSKTNNYKVFFLSHHISAYLVTDNCKYIFYFDDFGAFKSEK